MELLRDEETAQRLGEIMEEVVDWVRGRARMMLQVQSNSSEGLAATKEFVSQAKSLLKERAEEADIRLLPIDYDHLFTSILVELCKLRDPKPVIAALRVLGIEGLPALAEELGLSPERLKELQKAIWGAKPKDEEHEAG